MRAFIDKNLNQNQTRLCASRHALILHLESFLKKKKIQELNYSLSLSVLYVLLKKKNLKVPVTGDEFIEKY